MNAEIDEIRKRVAAFNHQYAQTGGFKSDELEDLELVLEELDRLTARVAELEKALRFYGQFERYHGPNQRLNGPDEYTPSGPYLYDVTRDGGSIARAALGERT